MRNLVYNIDFEVVAFLFAILLYVETCLHYPKKTRKNRIFRVLVVMVIVTDFFDLLSAFTITYGAEISRTLNMAVNSGYFMSGLFLCFVFHYYIENTVIPDEGRSVLMKANRVVLIVMELSMLANLFGGFYFSISEQGDYVHGPLYLAMHLASCWFVLCGSIALIVNRRLLKRTQFVSSILFVAMYTVAVILQTFVFSDVFIIMPTVSAMLIIAIFSLESPDYLQLQRILRELTDTKRQLEAANEKYYNLAYTDLMTGLQNRSAYNVRLEQMENALRSEQTILMMADVNNLKQLNDGYGHLIGDEAIEKVAKLLMECFEQPYLCYRIGGDEFAVVALDIDEAAFLVCYHRFLDAVKAEGERAPYPFSIASGYQRVGRLSLQEAIKAADESMYRDKQRFKQEGASI